MKLNKNQKEAAQTKDGYVLILAGAGTGKTTTLIARIQNLVTTGINPENILAITFTNKAANEMKKRLEKVLKDEATPITTATFHAFCAKILRQEIANLKYKPGFQIITESDQKNLVKQIIKREKSSVIFAEVFDVIKQNKMRNISPKQMLNDDEAPVKMIEIYEKYNKYLLEKNLMDFDDLINNTLNLLKKNKTVLQKIQKQYLYIHVDEYQDTSIVQNELIEVIAAKNKNLFVVGDDDQAIYSWRASDNTGILDFDLKHEATIIKLEDNYRSTKNILNIANSIIQENVERHEKELRTSAREGSQVKVQTYENDYKEAKAVVSSIKELKDKGANLNNIAILYRVNKLSKFYEDELVRQKINYHMTGGIRFYERREVKDLISYLKFIYNHNDVLAFERIANVPKRKIGSVTIEKIKEISQKNKISLLEACIESNNEKLNQFGKVIFDAQEKFAVDSVKSIKWLLEEIGYFEDMEKNYVKDEVLEKKDNIETFIDAVRDAKKRSTNFSLESFLSDLTINVSLENLDSGVNLMTIHAAKGQEFEYVFVVGAKDGIMPIHDANLEEERRLLYVAVTRAKKHLTISYSIKANYKSNSLSPFLINVPEHLFEYFDLYGNKILHTGIKIEKKKVPKLNVKEGFNKNDYIKHSKFGKGIIKSVNKDGILKIKFDNGEVKDLIPTTKTVRKINKK